MNNFFGDSMDDPRTALILGMASGLLGTRGSLAQGLSAGLLGGMDQYQSARKMKMLAEQQKREDELQRLKIEAMRKPQSPLRVVGNAIFDEATRQWITPPQQDKPDRQFEPTPYQKLMNQLFDPNTPEEMKPLIQKQMDALNYRPPPMVGFTPTLDANGNIVFPQTRAPIGAPTPAPVVAPPKPPVRMPASLIKAQDELISESKTAERVNQMLGKHINALESGQVKLGPVTTPASVVRNALGSSDEQSRGYGSLRSDLEKMRNDSLRLNAGVQTEGDSQRAWNEVTQFWLTDPKLVAQRLREIQGYNQQAIAERKARIAQMREDAGVGQMSSQEQVPQQSQPSNANTSLRQQAQNAINKGADPAKVRERFKQQTGEDL